MAVTQSVHLGYEIGTGKPVSIPLRHLAITGQTQESGKTTTLEALAARAGCPTIAFVTKRGEGSFAAGERMQPYFRDRADWQFVTALLDATLQEKNKFLRPWIMKICRTTRTLADVQAAVRKALEKATGINEGVYTQLDAYLDLVVPEIHRRPLAERIRLQPGLNVMDVSTYATPMQMLFVQSAIDWINEHERRVVTIVPEAWEFIPEGKGSPAKASAVSLVRKGAGLGNFIWVDSQDMAGVDKTILRGCTVWIIGVQREANEIKRNLANIPAGIQRPRPTDIARLDRGQFFACWKDRTVKVYVQPAWMPAEQAAAVARGEAAVSHAPDPPVRALVPPDPDPEPTEDDIMASAAEEKLDRVLDILTEFAARGQNAQAAVSAAGAGPATAVDEESLYQRFKSRLQLEAPALIRVMVNKPEIAVELSREEIRADGTSAYGLLALLIKEGFFDSSQNGNAAWKEMQRRGFGGIAARVYEQLPKLTTQGFLTKEGKDGYKAVPSMKTNITRK